MSESNVFSCRLQAGLTTTIIMSESEENAFPWLAELLQLTDSAFPTGAYAHSQGFEEVVRLGLVHDAESMRLYLERHLWPMLIHFEMPVVRYAQDAARAGDRAGLLSLDASVDATKTARELREASRAIGRRRLHALCDADPSPVLADFGRAVEEGRTPSHHAVVYGLGLAHLPVRALLTSWAFQSLSAVCISAPKLFRIGQDAARRVLTASLAGVEEKIESSLDLTREELGWFDPAVEIASMQHEIAYERLFIS
jgi:urease accessory protein